MGLWAKIFKKKDTKPESAPVQAEEPIMSDRDFIIDEKASDAPQKSESAPSKKAEAGEEPKPAPVKKAEPDEKPKPAKKKPAPAKVAEKATISQAKKPAAQTETKQPAEKEDMQNKDSSRPGAFFEIKKSKDNRFVFNLYAANHVIVATSQIYSSAASALIGIKSVIANAESAPIEDQTIKEHEVLTYPKWEIYKDKGDAFRFRLNASNGSTICHSQGYTSKVSCKNGIESIRKNAKSAKIDKAYLQKDEKK